MPSKNSLSQIKQLKSGEKPILSSGNVTVKKQKVKRITKGFQVEIGRAHKWDILVAQMKGADKKKTSPELLDEALDFIFNKYSSVNRVSNKHIR